MSSFLRIKAKNSFDAGVILKTSHPNSSIHCYYYSLVQLMNDIINKNESIFSRSSYNFENFKKNSHKRRIAKIHKFLSEEKKISEAFQIESALSYLNLERNSADYDEDKPYTIKLSKLIEIETKAVFEILYNLNQ